MRKITWFGCATLLLASLGCASADRREPETQPAPRTTVESTSGQSATLTVHGLACPLCAHNINKQLLKVSGVQNVDVDLGSGLVRVRFADGTQPSDKELAAAVRAGGFTLNRIERP